MDRVHFGAWNVRGLNTRSSLEKSVKGDATSHYCRVNSISLLEMVETKIDLDDEEEVRGSLPFNWLHVTNGHLDRKGRIWIM